MQILAFGDSITYGAWDNEGGSWPSRIKKELNQRASQDKDFWGIIYNLGICGDTTAGLNKRFINEAERRLDSEEELYIIFAFGANDAAYIPKEERFRVPPEDFVSNLRQAIRQARAFTPNLIFLTITPVNDMLVKNIEDGKVRSNEYVEQYNRELRQLADEESITLIDINKRFTETDHTALLAADGLHPNTQGHEMIFQQVWQYFKDKT